MHMSPAGPALNRATDGPRRVARRSVLLDLVSFVAVGGTAALAFAGVSSTLIALGTGVPDWIVSVLCYSGFIGPVYLAHRYLSFRSATPHRTALPRYLAVQASAIALSAVFSYVSYRVLQLPGMSAALLVIGLTSGVNFVVLKLWAFAQAASRPEAPQL